MSNKIEIRCPKCKKRQVVTSLSELVCKNCGCSINPEDADIVVHAKEKCRECGKTLSKDEIMPAYSWDEERQAYIFCGFICIDCAMGLEEQDKGGIAGDGFDTQCEFFYS